MTKENLQQKVKSAFCLTCNVVETFIKYKELYVCRGCNTKVVPQYFELEKTLQEWVDNYSKEGR